MEKSTGALIGTALLYYEKEVECWEIAYNFGRAYWGKGYATEAMQRVMSFASSELHIPEIVGRYAIENPNSGNVLKKLDFRYEKRYPIHATMERSCERAFSADGVSIHSASNKKASVPHRDECQIVM